MHVDRFSVIGIGPVLVKLFEKDGCEFVISAFPFGAYVHIVGMEAEDPDPDPAETDADANKGLDTSNVATQWAEGGAAQASQLPTGRKNYRDCSVGARMLAVVGGPLANYLAAMLIMVSIYAFAGTRHQAVITEFNPESPAEIAGLAVGDVFVTVDGESVQGERAELLVIRATSARAGQTVDITVDRDGEDITKAVTLNAKGPAMNLQLSGHGDYHPMPAGQAIAEGVAFPIDTTARQLAGLWAMITGQSSGEVGGPVQIVKMMKKSWDEGLIAFIAFSALISTILGMFNILPIPALDGGRMVFLIYEAVTRRRFDPMKEEKIHGVAMLILLGLFVLVTIRDIRGKPEEEEESTPDATEAPAKLEQSGEAAN